MSTSLIHIPHGKEVQMKIPNEVLLKNFSLRKQDLAKVNQEQLNYALDSINYRPRKCLNWKFPYEVLCDELLHLN